LAEIENKRLQRLRMKIDHLSYDVEWIKGADNKEADALSRAPSSRATTEDELDEPHDEAIAITAYLSYDSDGLSGSGQGEVNAVFGSDHYDAAIDDAIQTTETNSDLIVKQVLAAGNEDEIYKQVREWIRTGFPDRKSVEAKFDPYLREQDQFRLDDDLILYQSPDAPASKPRIFVPEKLRRRFIEYLKLLHSHPNRMVARARKCLWWPFMNAELQQEHRKCKTCVERSPSNPTDNLIVHEPATYPYQHIHVDIGHYSGNQWLFGADQFTGWPIARYLGRSATTEDVIKALTSEFKPFGIPEKIFSDGGPQFISTEYKDWCKRMDIEDVLSSPYNHQSNGLAENSVKEMKKLVHCMYEPRSGQIAEEEWARAFLVYVNTPKRPLNVSPSQLMFGRDLRDGVPQLKDMLTPEHQAAIERRAKAIEDHQLSIQKPDRLPPLAVGQRVAVQDATTKRWTKQGVILEQTKRRGYRVKLDSGAVMLRNRKFLKPMPAKAAPTASASTSTPARPQPPTTSPPGTPSEQPTLRRSTRSRRQPVRFS